MKCYELKGLIFDSIYYNDEFDEYKKSQVIAFLRMFLTEYNFDDYFENHHISEFEYKIYFKSHMKEIYPIAHKEIKKYYKNKGVFVK